MSEDDTAPGAGNRDFSATRIVSKTFELDGIEFSWWAVDDAPAFVTVSSRWFGSKSAFAKSDPEATARRLAESIVAQSREKADQVRAQLKARADRRTVD